MTEKLFYSDPYLAEFEANVIHQVRNGDLWLVQLDKTCFYPEGGGQPADRGFLNGIPVVDVQRENGKVYHYLPEKPAGPRVRGKIDFARRFDFMQQHSGQHLISACFLQEGNLPTVSANLGSEYTTMELDCKTISDDLLQRVEYRANRIIRQNAVIKCYWINRNELKNIPLRKAPPELEKIRIVEIENVDYSACGGTHVSRSGEVELALYTGVEKIRGRVRVYWKIGRRAFDDFHFKTELLNRLSRELSCGIPDLAASVENFKQQVKLQTREKKNLEEILAEQTAELFYLKAPQEASYRIICERLEFENPRLLNIVAEKLIRKPGTIAILITEAETRLQWSVGISNTVELPLNEILKPLLPLIGGKGGGRPHLWSGGGNNVKGVDEFLEKLVSSIRRRLKPE